MNLVYQNLNYKSIKVPSDLVSVVKKTSSVQRFKDPRYPAGLVSDTLLNHLFRLVALVNYLNINNKIKSDVIRTIWIHDLPEVILGDLPAVLKSDKLVTEYDEKKVAKDILTKSDFDLYVNYDNSSNFLKNKSDTYDEVGLISRILDSIDGNLFFHLHVYRWITTGKKTLPPETALEYTFTQKIKYLSMIGTLSNKKLKVLLVELLDWEIDQIRLMWNKHTKLIPEIIKHFL